MDIKHILGICLFIVLVGITAGSRRSRCSAHCDRRGYFRWPFYCDNVSEPFCCGDKHLRYCCGNATLDISGDYQDVYVCPRSSWWQQHWQIVLGLLGTIILVTLCTACCCHMKHNRERFIRPRRSENGGRVNTVSAGVEDEGTEPRTQHFNPDSPFAFTPPDYDSLPKEPPKYEDIYENGAGNPASDWDAPPPESTRTNENGPFRSSNNNTSSQRRPGIHITTHGTPPSGELPPYEMAELEPSRAQGVSTRNSNNTNMPAQPSTSVREAVNVVSTPLTVRCQAGATEQNTNMNPSSGER